MSATPIRAWHRTFAAHVGELVKLVGLYVEKLNFQPINPRFQVT